MEGTREDAEEIVEFTKVFLQYAYEFPKKIEKLKEKIDERKKERK